MTIVIKFVNIYNVIGTELIQNSSSKFMLLFYDSDILIQV